MSARRSPVERDAREIALEALVRGRAAETKARAIFTYAIRSLEERTTWAVQDGLIPLARRRARAAELLEESKTRLYKRYERAVAAELALSGLVRDARVRDVAGIRVPADVVLTIDEDVTSKYIFAKDEHGERHIVYAGELELVEEPTPAAEPDPFQVGEDVLTPRGPGVVEHVDLVSGITVRVADGETWRYEPDQLTRYTPARAGDRLIVRGIGAQATVLDVQEDGYTVRYDDAPDRVLRCPFGDVLQVLGVDDLLVDVVVPA